MFLFYELTVYVLFLNDRCFCFPICNDIIFFTGNWLFTVAWLLDFASGNFPKILFNRIGGRVSAPYPSIHPSTNPSIHPHGHPSNKTPIQLTKPA